MRPRRGTETRQRQKQVGVRLTDREHDGLVGLARTHKVSPPQLLRALLIAELRRPPVDSTPREDQP